MIIKEGIGSYDPHIWLDPIIVIEMAKIIKDVFSKLIKKTKIIMKKILIYFNQII